MNNKDKKIKEAEALQKELEFELAELRKKRLQSQQNRKLFFTILLLLSVIPIFFLKNPVYWILSVAMTVVWMIIKQQRKNLRK